MILVPVTIYEVSHWLVGDLCDRPPHVLPEKGRRVHDDNSSASLNEHGVIRPACDVVNPVANLLSYIALLEPLRIEQCPRRPGRNGSIVLLRRIWHAGGTELIRIM